MSPLIFLSIGLAVGLLCSDTLIRRAYARLEKLEIRNATLTGIAREAILRAKEWAS
jgi:hypothetical protein